LIRLTRGLRLDAYFTFGNETKTERVVVEESNKLRERTCDDTKNY